MLYLGDDWAEDHHDVELVDDHGRRLARRRLREGLPQRAAQPQHLPRPLPDQCLVGAGNQFGRLDRGAVADDRAVMGVVQTHDLREQHFPFTIHPPNSA